MGGGNKKGINCAVVNPLWVDYPSFYLDGGVIFTTLLSTGSCERR